jgi:thiosulfate/3-mercaptopyruvate sulfurtransferase
VSADWLARHVDDVTVVDVRWYLDGRSGRAAYDGGHLPGAHYLDVDTDLSAPPSKEGGRHPLPDVAAFDAALGRLGIDDARPVVVYDDAGGSIAARLWWMLRAIGQPVAVLDGGLRAWQGQLVNHVPSAEPVTRAARRWPSDRFVDADRVELLRNDPHAVVVDARAAARYAHGDPSIDPRPGHIPGARSAPWSDNLDPATGCFRDAASLREHYRELGAADAGIVVAYCGSGVTACHDLLALDLAGMQNTVLFTGSWSAWGADEKRPAESGEPAEI